MADPETQEIGWYDPHPRGIIPLEPGAFRVSRSLRQRVRQQSFVITTDIAFEKVMRACGEPRPNDGAWITEPLIQAYTTLHRFGHAHSIEAWIEDASNTRNLVGGLYGVSIGGLFAGESMFSKPDLGGTDASKVCLVHLVGHLRRRGFTLLDTQFHNPHLNQFGCVEIARSSYRTRLREAIGQTKDWLPFAATGCEEAPAG